MKQPHTIGISTFNVVSRNKTTINRDIPNVYSHKYYIGYTVDVYN